MVIGIGSMIGAGVFAIFGPAAQVAGTGLLIGLVIAAFLACCNATASAMALTSLMRDRCGTAATCSTATCA